MKKQILTKQDIQRDLLVKINKSKKLAMFLMTCTAVAILFYTLFIMNYTNIMAAYASGRHIGIFPPTWGLFIGPVAILLLIICLLECYYIDLFKVKSGKFTVIEEKICQRKKEQISYYRRSDKENSLYFRCGRVAVDHEVYLHANPGDLFYVIVLRTRKGPRLVYHTKFYEIEKS